MELETQRLRIRALSEKDAPAYFKLSQNGGFRSFQISDYRRKSIEDTENWIHALSEYQKRNGIGIYGVFDKDNDALIGICALKYLGAEKASPVELMYRVSDSYWGKGFGLEIGKALVDLGLGMIGLPSIVGTVDPKNDPSRKILLKLGFQFKELIAIEGLQEELYELRPIK